VLERRITAAGIDHRDEERRAPGRLAVDDKHILQDAERIRSQTVGNIEGYQTIGDRTSETLRHNIGGREQFRNSQAEFELLTVSKEGQGLAGWFVFLDFVHGDKGAVFSAVLFGLV